MALERVLRVVAALALLLPSAQAEYLILVDNASGDFLRPALSAPLPLTTEGAAAALLALLDAPPMTLNDVDVHAQVDSLLASNPFARPQAVFSLNVLGADDTEFMPGTANTKAVCCGDDMHHVSLAAGGHSLQTLEAGALAVQRMDLACADLQQLCDAQCMEAAVRALAAHTGGSYVAGDAPMRGSLLWTAGEEAAEMALNLTNRVDRAVAVELACLARFATEALPQAPKRALLTGTLRSLEGARAAHGVQSSPYKAAAGWLARGIGMVNNALHDAFGGKVVRRVVLQGGGGDLRAARRGLLQMGGSNHRDYHAWLDSSLMGMVGFALVIITLLCIVCLFSIEIKQDTILYGKGKTE